MSAMSLRSLRAAEAVSSSASTTIRPPTMCNPPANRNVAATSVLRQQGLVIVSRLSSSLTFAVIAMRAILPLVRNSSQPVTWMRHIRLFEAKEIAVDRSGYGKLDLVRRSQERLHALQLHDARNTPACGRRGNRIHACRRGNRAV